MPGCTTSDVINFAFYVRLVVLHRDTLQLCVISCKDFFTYYITNVANKYFNLSRVPFEGKKRPLCIWVNTNSTQEPVLDPAGGVMTILSLRIRYGYPPCTRYNDKISYTDNLTSMETPSQAVTVNQKLYRNIIIQYFEYSILQATYF